MISPEAANLCGLDFIDFKAPFRFNHFRHGSFYITQCITCDVRIGYATRNVKFLVAPLKVGLILGLTWLTDNRNLFRLMQDVRGNFFFRTPIVSPPYAALDMITIKGSRADDQVATIHSPNLRYDVFITSPVLFPYLGLFGEPDCLGAIELISDYEHIIETHRAQLHRADRIYPLSELDDSLLEKEIQDLLAAGHIRKSSAKAVTTAFFVPKVNDTTARRLVIDYTKLNAATKPFNQFPFHLPDITELLASIPGGSWFSKLSVREAFHRIRMRETDISKTAFICSHGTFEWLTMPATLKYAAVSFQCFIQKILHQHLNSKLFVFLGNIIIFSPSRRQNITDVTMVLDILAENLLLVDLEKCELFQSKISFFGFHITSDGSTLQESKTEAIRSWPVPTNVQSVRVFLRTVDYYHDFIFGFANLAAPLEEIVSTNEFSWTEECQLAFDSLKGSLITSPLLKRFAQEKKTQLEANASSSGIGAVLSQLQEDGIYHPVAFYSKKLISQQQEYSSDERELLAIVEALEHWSYHLFGNDVVILTNIGVFRSITEKVVDSPILQKCKNILNRYFFTVRQHSVKVNPVAESLSYRFENGQLRILDGNLTNSDLPSLDPALSVPTYSSPAKLIDFSLTVPEAFPVFDSEILSLVQASQQNIVRIPKEWDLINGLWRNIHGKIIVPNDDVELQTKIIDLAHCGILVHPQNDIFYKTVSDVFTWVYMEKDIYQYVLTCPTCHIKLSKPPKPSDFDIVPTPAIPFSHVHIEQILMKGEYTTGLIVVDRFTKYIQCAAGSKSDKISDICKKLDSIFNRCYGRYPSVLTCENSKWFIEPDFKAWAKIHRVELRFNIQYQPKIQGHIKNFYSEFQEKLRIYLKSNNLSTYKWHVGIEAVVNAMNQSPSNITGVIPYLALPGHNLLYKVNALYQVTNMHDLHKKMAKTVENSYMNSKHLKTKQRFNVGDPVLLQSKALRPFQEPSDTSGMVTPKLLGPFLIESVIDDNVYSLTMPPSWLYYPHPVKNVYGYRHLIPYNPTHDSPLPTQPIIILDGQYVLVHKVEFHTATHTTFGLPKDGEHIILSNDEIPESCQELLEAYKDSLRGTKRKPSFQSTIETLEKWTKRSKYKHPEDT